MYANDRANLQLSACSTVGSMRIAVDGRHLAAGRGIARYCEALFPRMEAVFPDDDWIVVPRATRGTYARAALLGRPTLNRAAGGADVVWAPAPAPLAVSRGVPFVLTVHDLTWLQRPHDFTWYERLWHRASRIGRQIDRADRIVCVSEATRGALLEHYGPDEEKVRVVQSGPGIGAGPRQTAPARTRAPYFLAVGALEPRKEPVLLARAWARARERGLTSQLWFAGGGRMGNEVGRHGARVLGPVDAGALHELYTGALAVVHAAALEGFGFPPVEAAVHGTPSIVADLPVYEETLGRGALRFPTGNEEALTEALLRMERDERLRAQLLELATVAVAKLSWERTARETRALLAEAAAGR